MPRPGVAGIELKGGFMQPPGSALTRTPPPARTPTHTAESVMAVQCERQCSEYPGAKRVCARSDILGGGACEAGARGAEGPGHSSHFRAEKAGDHGKTGMGNGSGKWGTEKGKRERVRGGPFSFLESSQGIRLLGAFKAAPASPVLACFARQQP